MSDYQIWTYTSDMNITDICAIDISQHKKISEGTAAKIETEFARLCTKDVRKFVSISDRPTFTIEYYMRKKYEPTYIISISSPTRSIIYDICFNSVRASHVKDLLERQLENLSAATHAFACAEIIVTERDDRDIRNELNDNNNQINPDNLNDLMLQFMEIFEDPNIH